MHNSIHVMITTIKELRDKAEQCSFGFSYTGDEDGNMTIQLSYCVESPSLCVRRLLFKSSIECIQFLESQRKEECEERRRVRCIVKELYL